MAKDARPVIVPLDGSRNAETAFPIALYLARSFGSVLRCIRVEHAPGNDGNMRAAEDEFVSYVGGLFNLHREEGVEWDASLLTGHPAEAILGESRGARMVVMASHGQGGLRSTLSGSVSDRVVRSSRIPVLVVAVQGQHRLADGPVLVALDGSPAAEAGLAVGRELAAATRLPVVLLQAWEPVPPPGIEFVPRADKVALEHAAAADAYLEATHWPGEEFVVMRGPPAPAIRQAADRLDASAVVVTSRGKGLAARLAGVPMVYHAPDAASL
jgi:nucleotide-binding universal stress UspA family protein